MIDPTTAEICAHVRDYESLPTTVHGKENAITEYQAARQATTSEKWLEAPDKFRVEMLSVDAWDDIETELNALNPFKTMNSVSSDSYFVQNGAKALNYNSAQNTANVYDFDSAKGVLVMTSALIDTVVGETFDVSTEGAATVAGRDCYVLASTPTDSADALSSLIDTYRLWVDHEYGYPLKQEYEYQLQEGAFIGQRWFAEIEFDSEIADDMFDCTPPEGCTVNG